MKFLDMPSSFFTTNNSILYYIALYFICLSLSVRPRESKRLDICYKMNSTWNSLNFTHKSPTKKKNENQKKIPAEFVNILYRDIFVHIGF